jgi:hypothetical protein
MRYMFPIRPLHFKKIKIFLSASVGVHQRLKYLSQDVHEAHDFLRFVQPDKVVEQLEFAARA